MKLLVVGVNHKTAPIKMREKLAFSASEIPNALQQLSQFTAGSVILSTCNRTEIYALVHPDALKNTQHGNSSNHPIDIAFENIKSWLLEYKSINIDNLNDSLYVYKEQQAITHWIRVASGLDSMILGEPQILGQIKKSVQQANENGSINNQFGWIIEQIFSATKHVRHDTQVGEQAVTLGFATAKLATQIFDDLSTCKLLIVAAGEMNRLVAAHVVGLGVQSVTVCNRSQQKAEQLAAELKQINENLMVHIEPLKNLSKCLESADIVSSCSGSMQTLINVSMMKKAIKKRRYRPILLVDLAVPRDIEEKVARLDEVYLYSIDDLQHVISGNIERRKQAAVDAELMVSQMVVEIERRFQVKQVGKDIQTYRELSEQQAQQVLVDCLQQLQSSDVSTEEAMTELTRRLTQTLMHAPSALLRKVAREGDQGTVDLVVNTLKDAYRQ